MAPLKAIKKDGTDANVLRVQGLASTLLGLLKERQQIPISLQSDLDATISHTFPASKDLAYAHKSSSFDEIGSALWNAATFAAREVDASQQPAIKQSKLLVHLRTLAFLLLDAAHCSSSRRRKNADQRTRVFRVALKATRFCLDADALELAQRVLERCSEYVEVIEDAPAIELVTNEDKSAQETISHAFVAQYYILRVAHAWKSKRLDIANHFADKLDVRVVASSADLTEKVVELYYEMGKSFREADTPKTAEAWLERAVSSLGRRYSISTEGNLEDLMLAVISLLVDCLLVDPDPGRRRRAESLLHELQDIHNLGNRLVVLTMHLRIVLASESIPDGSADAILKKMVGFTVLTEETFRSIMHWIHKVSQHNASVACQGLQQLVSSRLLPDLDTAMEESQLQDWLEKAMTTHTMLSASEAYPDKAAARHNLTCLFDLVHERSRILPSSRATHALQTLIWKASGGLQGGEAQAWFELLQHPLFEGAGLVNKARIGRKAITMAMDNDALDLARAAFYRMSPSVRDEVTSRYLAYRLALRMQDDALAAESLRILLKHAGHDRKYLYASVLEAQQSSNRGIAVAALQALIEVLPTEVHLPSLLRCVARLLIGEFDNLTRELDDVAHEVIRVFEAAAMQTREMFQGPEDQWRTEIQWWSKNAFNLALRLCTDAHPSHLVRLLRVCIKFFELYPDDVGLMHHDDLVRRKQICHFLCCSALIVLARSAQEREGRLQSYSEARKEIASFMSSCKPATGEGENDIQIRARGLEMLKFDVESVFRLGRWDQLDQVLGKCLEFEGTCQWETLADLIIIIHDHASGLDIDSNATEKIPQLLQKIINETWKKSKDVVKLARWLRVTFSIELDGSDGEISLKLVEQAAKMAKRGSEGPHDRYPEDELQWMATTAFNRALDLLAQEEYEAANTWIENALELAKWADDSGSLHTELTRNREEASRRMAQSES